MKSKTIQIRVTEEEKEFYNRVRNNLKWSYSTLFREGVRFLVKYKEMDE